MGIRYNYGDLNDVVALLKRSPMTRQAYLPVWFPEDTGANYEQRVPCTLGYHFLLRNGVLGITYFIRSCDFVRHFSDDVYMAGRLCQWVADQVADGNVGYLSMHIGSFHIFDGDVAKLKRDYGF
jgi:thymidylate synthase